MLTSYRLALGFDASSLQADLAQIAGGEWKEHFNKGYYEGEWKGLALRSTTGNAQQLYRDPTDERTAIDTPLLLRCAYFQTVLQAFECPLHNVRLLGLSAGSTIKEHEDYMLGFEYGLVRIHIPIVTDPRVEFIVDRQPLVMQPGEVWYIDFSKPHSVVNRSDHDRVHLVLDCGVNEWLTRMLPVAQES
ncbi:MAG: aspartyl/asparaginyl beta-hydroxylase domain-containing protein [Tahibacter sp.]